MSDDEDLVVDCYRLTAVVRELYGLLRPGMVASERVVVDGAELLPGLVRQLIEEKERQRVRADVLEHQADDHERNLRDAVADTRAERDRLRAALRAVMTETGTSSLAYHYARDALDGSEEGA